MKALLLDLLQVLGLSAAVMFLVVMICLFAWLATSMIAEICKILRDQ